MKKVYLGLIGVCLAVFVWYGFTMSSTTGDYNEGTYFGFDEEHNYTAAVYVGEDGMIKSVLIDAAYTSDCKIVDEEAECTGITKRTLGDDYNMKTYGGAEYEWYEQADLFGDMVVEEQGLDFVDWRYKDSDDKIVTEMPIGQELDDEVYTDAVSGVTVHVAEMYKAVEEALKLAE